MIRKLFLTLLISILTLFICNAENSKIDSLLKILKSQKVDFAKVNTINSLAYEFRRSNPDTAVYFANEALKFGTNLNYSSGIADSYLNMAEAKIILQEFDAALKNLIEAIEGGKIER